MWGGDSRPIFAQSMLLENKSDKSRGCGAGHRRWNIVKACNTNDYPKHYHNISFDAECSLYIRPFESKPICCST